MTLNSKLALVAVGLGALAIAGNPYGGHQVTIDTRELATIVQSEVDHITAEELAGWIIRGDTDYRLIDLREPGAYAEYHIPTAENVPITNLEDYPIYRNERIVLYSDGGIHSAQAWFLLRARQYRGAYILLGGLDLWIDDVLFPEIAVDVAESTPAEAERIAEISRFFGGQPRVGGSDLEPTAAAPLPKVEAPAAPITTRRGKKKKEGC